MSNKQYITSSELIFLILFFTLTLLCGLLGSIASNSLPDWLKDYRTLSWPLFWILLLAGIWVLYRQNRRRKQEITHKETRSDPSNHSSNQAAPKQSTNLSDQKKKFTEPESCNSKELASSQFCFSSSSLMRFGRAHHAAELLPNGRIIVIGGMSVCPDVMPRQEVLASAEVFDPVTMNFYSQGRLVIRRYFFASVRLPSNNIIVIGGVGEDGQALDSVELYDVHTNSFSIISRMSIARRGHTATLLRNGQVLIAGGNNSTYERIASAEIFDPISNRFFPAGDMKDARLTEHTPNAICLEDGRVLFAGGYGVKGELASIEIYNPRNSQFTSGGQMATPRACHALTKLPDGNILITGGYESKGGHLSSAELYNPITQDTCLLPQMNVAHFHHTATMLTDGSVVIAGGLSPIVELYEPSSKSFKKIGQLNTFRNLHTANYLSGHQLVLIGGASQSGISLANAEIMIFNDGSIAS